MNANDIQDLFRRLDVTYRTDKSFAELTTLRVGGKIEYTAYPDSRRKLISLLRALSEAGERYFVLGNGSNVLASDNLFDGVAVCTKRVDGLQVRGDKVIADCGVNTCALFALLKKRGLGGGEFLGCIPSTFGGAVRGNAGCYGQDMSGVVTSVTALCADGKVRTFDNAACGFARRNSVFKQQNAVVLSVTMHFTPSTPQAVEQIFAEMHDKKKASQPLGQPSAGSTLFHERLSLSPLLDRLGTKGYRVGGAAVSKKHAGFVLNIDKAEAKDIYYITQYQKQRLWQVYGLTAHTEVTLVGFDDD